MPKFILTAIHTDENGQEEAKVTSEFDAEFLDDVVGYMQDFLHGVGYGFRGELNISDPTWR